MMMAILLASWTIAAKPPVRILVNLKNAAGGRPFCNTNGILQGGVVSKSMAINENQSKGARR